MPLNEDRIKNIKEAILLVCMLYFYGLSLALQFHRPTYGMDQLFVFLPFSLLFLVALGLEVTLVWWNRLSFILWCAAWFLAYGFIWLYLAPATYGNWIIPYALVIPLVIAFYGGFAYAYSIIFSSFFFPRRPLSRSQIDEALSALPGWKVTDTVVEKTYHFRDPEEAINFMNTVARNTRRSLYCSRLVVSYVDVSVQLYDWELKALSARVMNTAKRLDAAVF